MFSLLQINHLPCDSHKKLVYCTPLNVVVWHDLLLSVLSEIKCKYSNDEAIMVDTLPYQGSC